MKISSASFLLLLLLPGGITLATEYKTERALRTEIDVSLKMETTEMRIERDGEPVDAPGGGMSTETVHKEVHVDTVVEVKEGRPTKVHRNFETLSGKVSRSFGEGSSEREIECPLDGVTLEIKRGADGKVEVVATEGKGVDDKVLEGHVPENFLDGLLPEGDVEVDASWDLEPEAIQRALRADVSQALYPRPEREEGGGGGERPRRGMRGGGADVNLFQHAEWKGKAKLVSTDTQVDGKECAVVELKLEASGDLPEPEFGGWRGDRSLEPAFGALPAARNTYDISLEGKLQFAIKDKCPLSLDLDGSAKTETNREVTREEHTMKFHVVLEGSVSYKVAVAPNPE